MTAAIGIQDHPVRKLGLRPPDPVAQARMLAFGLTGVVPAHPLAADHLASVAAFNGATNFSYGTCGPCSVANSVIITWKYLLGEDITVSDDAIFALYRASGNPDFDPVTDADDLGVDMTVMLDALAKTGIDITHADGTVENVKPLIYGKVPQPIDNIRAATSIFGVAILAVDLKVAQQSQTDAGLWDYVSGSGEWGGHAIAGGKYTSSASAHTADETVVSWTQPVGVSDAFWSHQGQETYAIVWPPLWEHPAFQAGIDQAALRTAFKNLTGRDLPEPPPPPIPPDPPPGDSPTAAEAKLGAVLLKRNANGTAWVDQRHSGYVTTVAVAGRVFLAETGQL